MRIQNTTGRYFPLTNKWEGSGGKIDWYNTFDVASGCIWNNKIIKEIKLVYEKVDDNYIKV